MNLVRIGHVHGRSQGLENGQSPPEDWD